MQGSVYGIKFEAPLSREKDRLVVLSYVGDTNIAERDLTKTKITIEDVYIIIQKSNNR